MPTCLQERETTIDNKERRINELRLKSKELEKLMDPQKHNLNNLPIRKEDDRRKVSNWVPTPYPNPQHQTKHSTNPNPN